MHVDLKQIKQNFLRIFAPAGLKLGTFFTVLGELSQPLTLIKMYLVI